MRCKTVFADLIDGPLAHMPSGKFGANSAWVICAATATTFSAPQEPSPAITPEFAARPCDGGSSQYPHAWPDPPAHQTCIYRPIGPGQNHS